MNDDMSDDALIRIADAVADGTPVDWEGERSKAPELGQELDGLRILAKIGVSSDLKHPDSTLEGRDADHRPADRLKGPAYLFTWGTLQILEELGSGSFGQVYRAFDPGLGIEVALKLRKLGATDDPESVQKFLDEARRMARVHHANVVTVHGAAVQDGRVGIWMELVAGETLEELLERSGRLGAREAAGIGIELCRALAAVHESGVIHRDVKTNNIMRDARGRIVLMDFGSGSELPRTGAPFETRHVHGTPLFMAPEQLTGTVAGPPTDIYGLGVVLYRLVSKNFPVYAESLPELAVLHQADPVPLRDYRPDLPAEFVRVVHRAIARRPEDRYATAGGMELALVKAMDESASNSTVADRNPTSPIWMIAAGAALVAALLLILLLQPKKAEPPEGKPGPAYRGTVLTANASVYRHTATGDEPLALGARVAPNDLLSMLVESSAPMHLYVLAEDAKGNVFVLFPNPSLKLRNPIPSGGRYRLPGRSDDGMERYWNVTSAGERESIIAIGSLAPLSDLEREIARFPSVELGRRAEPRRVSDDTVGRLRGIGGLEVSPDAADFGSPQGLGNAIARGLALSGSRDSIWTWQTQFVNPAP